MSVKLATFATPDMHKSAITCGDSALLYGAGWFWEYDPHSPSLLRFYDDHREILSNPRGAGLWLWKPAVVLDAMARMKDGDILIYSDAGVEFLDNVNHIIDRMDQDIFLFGNMWEHAHWCKRDIVEEIMPHSQTNEWGEVYTEFQSDGFEGFGKQVQASVIFFRVSDYSKRFVKEWLGWCLFEGGRLIDDSPSRTPNHPEFQENRHDQAILTTLAYRDGLRLHWWPANYNDGAFIYERGDYPDEGYPVIVNHHRRRNHEWAASSIGRLSKSIETFHEKLQEASAT